MASSGAMPCIMAALCRSEAVIGPARFLPLRSSRTSLRAVSSASPFSSIRCLSTRPPSVTAPSGSRSSPVSVFATSTSANRSATPDPDRPLDAEVDEQMLYGSDGEEGIVPSEESMSCVSVIFRLASWLNPVSFCLCLSASHFSPCLSVTGLQMQPMQMKHWQRFYSLFRQTPVRHALYSDFRMLSLDASHVTHLTFLTSSLTHSRTHALAHSLIARSLTQSLFLSCFSPSSSFSFTELVLLSIHITTCCEKSFLRGTEHDCS